MNYITNSYLYVTLIKFHGNDCVPAAVFILCFRKKNRDIITVIFKRVSNSKVTNIFVL